ncbi:metalloendopeptidase [Coemansia sp. RSA 2526]|nr:metalloendopeptidase [Coemansia sp. RSA 2526]
MVTRLQQVVKGAALNFRRTPAEISAAAARLTAREKQVHDKVAAQTQPTFANTIAPLARLENASGGEAALISFLQNVSTDKQVRDASSEAEKALALSRMTSQMRSDVYGSVKKVLDDTQGLKELAPEDRALAESMARQYRRSGLGLSADQRAKLEHTRKRLIELGIEFSRNTNEADGVELFTRAELAGLPDSYFCERATETVDGVEKFVVTTKYPDLVPVMQMAKSEATRRRMLLAEETRCPENIRLLQEAVALRLDAARQLGYKTHAEFVLEENMAKTPDSVLEFEKDLRQRLDVLADSEITEIEQLKQADKKAANETYTGLYNWDFRYYSNLVKERKHKVNEERVKQYFSVEPVTRGILDIYQDILKLRFDKVENPPVWHPDVTMYEVWEADNSAFLGHIYLDLFPRQGKYGHACVNPIQNGSENSDGSRVYPVAAILANFPKPTSTTPALLTHDDVITLLHEMGHLLHHICIQTKWAHFGLDSVQHDFIECPSQLFENWGWEPSVLQKFAAHYKTGERIPKELVAQLVAAKNEGAGLFNLRQVFFGMFDMAIHNTEDANVDVEATYKALREQITRFSGGSGPGCGAATFGHMMGGYDAGYYGYLWAKSFSADMYATRFTKDGITNAQTGMDYRREILCPGGSIDASVGLERFLGRAPSSAAFLESIGVANSQ